MTTLTPMSLSVPRLGVPVDIWTFATTHWASTAVAAGDSTLSVPASDLHPAFSVVPNALLRRPGA